MPLKKLFRTYYSLTKPGIIRGNLLTAAAGFLLASKGNIDSKLFLATLAGIALVIGSACVVNNYIDRGIDKLMSRTKKRALVSGLVSGRSALIYASVLGIAGFLVLGIYTNLLTVALGALAMLVYVVLYGVAKRRSVHGTVVGSIAGALPPMAGYCAVTNQLDAAALLLFLILICWQMPHFYAIAMYRYDDYAAAKLPVLPVKKGMKIAKIYILGYIAAFIIAAVLLSWRGGAGYSYVGVILLLGLVWLWRGVKGFKAADDKRWARGMFFFSLIVITGWCVMVGLNALLP